MTRLRTIVWLTAAVLTIAVIVALSIGDRERRYKETSSIEFISEPELIGPPSRP